MEFKHLGAMIIFVVVLIVVLSFFPFSLFDGTNSGIASFKLKQCDNQDLFDKFKNSNCHVINCEDKECDEDQEILWKQQISYLNKKDCSETDAECTTFQEQIWECEKDSDSEKCYVPTDSNIVASDLYNKLKSEMDKVCGKDYFSSIDSLRDEDPNFVKAMENYVNGDEEKLKNLFTIMHFESIGSFCPCKLNPGSAAVGLIQFVPSTASGLGTSTEQLCEMSRVEQFEYVKNYLGSSDAFSDLTDSYLKVFCPAVIGKEDSFVAIDKDGNGAPCNGGNALKTYNNNPLDTNSNGEITVGEIGNKINSKYASLYPKSTQVS